MQSNYNHHLYSYRVLLFWSIGFIIVFVYAFSFSSDNGDRSGKINIMMDDIDGSSDFDDDEHVGVMREEDIHDNDSGDVVDQDNRTVEMRYKHVIPYVALNGSISYSPILNLSNVSSPTAVCLFC
jgi:hypothetical protein